MIGWEHSFVHEFHHFFDAIVNNEAGCPVWRDLRGWLSQRGDLRCDCRVCEQEEFGGHQVLANIAPQVSFTCGAVEIAPKKPGTKIG